MRQVAAVARGTATASSFRPGRRQGTDARDGHGWDAGGRDRPRPGAPSLAAVSARWTTFPLFRGYGRPEKRGVYMGTLDGGEPTRILATETAAVYAPPGALLWVRDGVLVAQRFDPAREVISDQPIPVAQTVGLDVGVLRGAFAVSATGVLVHRAGGGRTAATDLGRSRRNRAGHRGPPDRDGLSSPELAPDGQRVAVQRTVQGNPDVWLMDTGRNVQSRFTFDASSEGHPLWSPDGSRVVFRSLRNGPWDLFEKAASGAGDEQPLLVTGELKSPLAWSPDGQVLLYAVQHPKTGMDLWALPLAGDRKPFPVVQTPFDELSGQFSPDGRWVSYQSNESGQCRFTSDRFRGSGGPWQVSTEGGSQPRWRPDGRELFYVAPDARLMAVPIAVGGTRRRWRGARRCRSSGRGSPAARTFPGLMSKPQYAVASDGRFLMNVAVEGATAPPITVVLNWDAALKK